MTKEEAKSCIQTIELLRRLAFNVHGVMDVIDAGNCDKIIALLSGESCEDCVSRQAVFDAFGLSEKTRKYGGDHSGYGTMMKYEIQDVIEDLPSVNPQPKTGHWIFDEILDKHYYCSECKSMGVDYWDFCPNCGARMVEPQERSGEE